MKSTCILSTSHRPTTSRRIGPAFSHNTGYQHVTTDLLIWLRFIHCIIVSFYCSLLLFLFDCWTKRWQIAKQVSMNCNGLYLLCHAHSQMHVYCTWLHNPLKLLTSVILLLCTDSSQPGWFHVETCIHVLGSWFSNIAAAKTIIKCLTTSMIKH